MGKIVVAYGRGMTTAGVDVLDGQLSTRSGWVDIKDGALVLREKRGGAIVGAVAAGAWVSYIFFEGESTRKGVSDE